MEDKLKWYEGLASAFDGNPIAAIFALLGLILLVVVSAALARKEEGFFQKGIVLIATVFCVGGLTWLLIKTTTDKFVLYEGTIDLTRKNVLVNRIMPHGETAYLGAIIGGDIRKVVFLGQGSGRHLGLKIPVCTTGECDENDRHVYSVHSRILKKAFLLQLWPIEPNEPNRGYSLRLLDSDGQLICQIFAEGEKPPDGAKTCSAVAANKMPGNRSAILRWFISSAAAQGTVPRQFDDFQRELADGNSDVRREARTRLLNLGDDAIPIMEQLLRTELDGEANERLLSNVLLAMRGMGSDRWAKVDAASKNRVVELLASNSGEVSSYARAVLRAYPDAEAIKQIVKLEQSIGAESSPRKEVLPRLLVAKADINYNLGVKAFRNVQKDPKSVDDWNISWESFEDAIAIKWNDQKAAQHPDYLKGYFGRALLLSEAMILNTPWKPKDRAVDFAAVRKAFQEFNAKAACYGCNYPYIEQVKASKCVLELDQTKGSELGASLSTCLAFFRNK